MGRLGVGEVSALPLSVNFQATSWERPQPKNRDQSSCEILHVHRKICCQGQPPIAVNSWGYLKDDTRTNQLPQLLVQYNSPGAITSDNRIPRRCGIFHSFSQSYALAQLGIILIPQRVSRRTSQTQPSSRYVVQHFDPPLSSRIPHIVNRQCWSVLSRSQYYSKLSNENGPNSRSVT